MPQTRTQIDASDLRKVNRVLDRIQDDLQDPDELAHGYAQAILDQAVRNAASRPTPQAPMAASVLGVSGDLIRPLAGGPPSAVGASSEFGSDIYLQFHRPHNSRGYWLFPAADSEQVLAAGDNILDEMIDKAVRRG